MLCRNPGSSVFLDVGLKQPEPEVPRYGDLLDEIRAQRSAEAFIDGGRKADAKLSKVIRADAGTRRPAHLRSDLIQVPREHVVVCLQGVQHFPYGLEVAGLYRADRVRS
jgi:hypothetical protein